MASRSTALLFELVARDNASPAFLKLGANAGKAADQVGRLEDRARGVGSSTAQTVKGIIGATASFAAFGAAVDITKQAVAFQASMTRIRTLTGASQAEVDRMSSGLLDMAGKVAQGPEALATSLYHVESVGLRGSKALDAVKVAAEGARIGGASLQDTTNSLTSTIASGITKTQSYSKTMSELLNTVGAGDMSFDDLNSALSTGLLTSMKAYGVSLEDVSAALATFGDLNIRGEDAATRLRMGVEALAKPAVGGTAALKSIGIQANELRDDLETGGLNKAVTDLRDHLNQAGITGNKVGGFLLDAFSKKGAAGVTQLINNFDKLSSKYAYTDHEALTFGQRWDAVTKTSSFKLASFGDTLDALGIKIALKALPAVSDLASVLTTGVEVGISVVTDALKPFEAAWDAASGPIGDVAGFLGDLLGDLKPLLPVFEGVAAAAGSMFLGFKAGTLIAEGIGALPGLFTALQNSVVLAASDVLGFSDSFASAQAVTAASAAGIIADADATAAAVDTAGDAAKLGWAGLAGPIGLAAAGVFSIISLFHSSTSASKEATDAAKAYSDALSSGGSGTVVDSIVTQLSNNDVPQKISALNSALAGTGYTADLSGRQFVTAIQGGGKALDTLRDRLATVMKQGTTQLYGNYGQVIGKNMTPAAQKASALLRDLNTQYTSLSKAAVKEIASFKALGTAAAPIQKIGATLGLTGAQVKDYAGILGLTVTANDNLVNATQANDAAIKAVATDYNTATVAGSAYLAALETFSKSAGTAADRAAIIGATLKAANGDALGFASSMNAGATASAQLVSDLASAAKQVGKNGESVKAYVASIVNLKNGTIDYSKAAAAPLITDLTSMQTAAMNAAQAMYQHEVATKGSKQAADDAYSAFHTLTTGALVGQAQQLGLTKDQAQKLADTYYGMPKSIKTLIEQEGADPVVEVLNKIGALLAKFTGQPWDATVSVNDQATSVIDQVKNELAGLGDKTVTLTEVYQRIQTGAKAAQVSHLPGSAAGSGSWTRDGKLPAGLSTVGESGWELVSTDSRGRSQVYSHSDSMRMTGLPSRLPGFAGGSGAVTHSGKSWFYGGIAYGSERAAENARARAGRSAAKADASALSSSVESAISGVGQAASSPFTLTDVGLARVQATLAHATAVLDTAVSKGLSAKLGAKYRGEIASLTRTMQAQLASLRVKIKGSDLAAITAGLTTSVDDTKSAFEQLLSDMRAAGASPSQLAASQTNETRILAAQTRLAQMTDYRSSVSDALTGQFDPSTYGSVTDFLNGIQSATARNQAYNADVSQLGSLAKGNSVFTAWLANLEKQGDTTTLDTLAGASPTQIAQVAAAVSSYQSSVAGGADAATTAQYGQSVTQTQGQINELVGLQKQVLAAVGEVAKAVGKHSAAASKHTQKQIEHTVDHLVRVTQRA